MSSKHTILILLFFAGLSFSYAQVFETSIDRSDLLKTKASIRNNHARIAEDEPLELPFWDDFSQSGATPDPELWVNSNNVEISADSGIDPPSYKVARFDGIKLNGSSYSFNFVDFESGDTDTLTSRTINLSELSPADNVYISFFYQKQGNGELPDGEDGLRLEFIKPDSSIIYGIEPNIINGDNIDDSDWHAAIVKIDSASLFHENFQFRFISTGRKTGPYDVWNIDYVYLNKNRSANDTSFLDKALNKSVSSPIIGFNSIPSSHLANGSSLATDIVRSGIHNLHNSSSGVVEGFVYSEIMAIDSLTMDTLYFNSIELESLRGDETSLSQVPAFSSKDVLSVSLHNISGLPSTTSYAEITTKLYINNEDPSGSINFLVNDTLVAKHYFKDYYAYDDGTAEKGAGVNTENNQIAIKYPFLGTKESKLWGIDMFFPQTIGYNQVGQQLRLVVWNSEDGKPGEQLFARFLNVPKIDSLNEFYRIEFEEPIAIADTFFIGWEQLSSNRIIVGLDKNIDSQDKIWLNTIGEWEPNAGQIVGSLMMRPVFSEKEEGVKVAISNPYEGITIYPNPTTGHMWMECEGEIPEFRIYGTTGQEIEPSYVEDNNKVLIDLSPFPNGLYLLQSTNTNQPFTKRIILVK